jgi:hypothetical protein
VVALRANVWPSLSIGAIGFLTRDLFSTVYSETSFKHALNERWGLQLAGQLSWQRSHGEELLGDFNTVTGGLRTALSYRATVLTVSGTRVNRNASIRSPFGGRPGFTSGMIFDFDRAGESAVRVGLSQNFAALGLPGFSVTADYTKGRNAVSVDGVPLGDENSVVVTADFRPERERLKGLWLRVRYGEGKRSNIIGDRREVRLILNYNLSAFR